MKIKKQVNKVAQKKKEETADNGKKEETTTISTQDPLEGVTGLSKHIVSSAKNESSSKAIIIVPIGIGVIVIAGVCGYFGYKKFKGRSMYNE